MKQPSLNLPPLLRGFCASVIPPDRRPVWQWLEEHFEVDESSPKPGPWELAYTPWVEFPLSCIQDPNVRSLCIKCPAQTAKTQTMIAALFWAIKEDPGFAMWVMANVSDAKEFFRDRIGPSIEKCQPVSDLLVKHVGEDYLFTSMVLYFIGAGSKAKLQGKPIKWLLLDEVRNYKKGYLSMVRKRVRANPNAKEIITSTPGKKGDEFSTVWQNGTQHVHHLRCPSCRALQQFNWDNFRWDSNETTKPGGIWDQVALKNTVRYHCEACGHRITDTSENRRVLTFDGQYIQKNPKALSENVSVSWSPLAVHWVSFFKIAWEYINAREAAKQGDKEPAKSFWTETIGIDWEDDLAVVEDFSFLEGRKQDYDFADVWAEPHARFIAADKGIKDGEHYYYVSRDFNRRAGSRLVEYGRCSSVLELEEIANSLNVPRGNRCIDSGYTANQVYRFCSAKGWKAFKGDKAEYYLLKDKNNRTYRCCWQRSNARPEGERIRGARIRVPLYRMSDTWTKDLLVEFMHGLVGDWTIPRKAGRDYMRQLGAEHRVAETKPDGSIKVVWKQILKDNHYFDCERMLLVAAIASKMLTAGSSESRQAA